MMWHFLEFQNTKCRDAALSLAVQFVRPGVLVLVPEDENDPRFAGVGFDHQGTAEMYAQRLQRLRVYDGTAWKLYMPGQ